MKRADLIKTIERFGCILLRHGAKHDWYTNPQTGVSQPIPRHREIKEPALVIGEVLCNLSPENQPQLFKVLNENFVIVPYDMRAARHNAKIWQEQEPLRQELRNADVPRQAIKADIAILSTALACSCEILYISDKDLIKLAQKHIRVKSVADIPIPPQQSRLLSTFTD
jgi:mRNA interferase HicA